MKIEKANIDQVETIKNIIDSSIKEIYPLYYNDASIDFFLKLHDRKTILKDIKDKNVYICYEGLKIVGTGTLINNKITRLFIRNDCHNNGYGKFLIEYFEDIISMRYSVAHLDTSFPDIKFYQSLGFELKEYKEQKYKNHILPYFDMRKNVINKSLFLVNYDGKRFKPFKTSENAETNEETIFSYNQEGKLIWAEYEGGNIIKGFIIGNVNEDGKLVFTYQHINKDNEIRIGQCFSIPKRHKSGKIVLEEEWTWLDNGQSGSSLLIEI